MGFLCIIAVFGCLFREFFQSIEQPGVVSPSELLMERFAEALAAPASLSFEVFRAATLSGLLWLDHQIRNRRIADVQDLMPCDALTEKVTSRL
jgi:hypothetical protein